jgi:hypothetical protein
MLRFGLLATASKTTIAILSALSALKVLVQTVFHSSTESPHIRFRFPAIDRQLLGLQEDTMNQI